MKSHSKPSVTVAQILLTFAVVLCSAHVSSAQTNTFPSSGNVGIGTTTPTYPLTIVKDQNGATVTALFNTSDGANAQVGSAASRTFDFSAKYISWGVTAPSFSGAGYGETAYFHSAGVPLKFGSNTNNDIFFFTNGITNSRMMITGGGNVGIGTTTPAAKLHVIGDVAVSGNIAAKYQDVAEWVPAAHALPPGTVVTLNPTESNLVEASSKAYDTGVAGVISEQPGITLGERAENKVLVATTGRVRVKVDASNAPIRIGDLLVTSEKEGIAMKSVPVDVGGVKIHRPGTIIGKALEPFAKGQGEILVLLSLQ